MLANAPIITTLPVVDLERAKDFYKNKLSLTEGSSMAGGVSFLAGNGTGIFLYQRAQTKADNTAASFQVSNIEEEVKQLKDKGVVFEQYDFPGLKTNDEGIATMEGTKSAWFKDTEGNILALTQM